MYFGGINGITTFYPDQIRDNPYAPAVTLLSIRQGGIPVLIENSYEEIDSLTLSGAKNDYEFEYAALSYSQPEENQYAYMLAGLDTEWNYIGTQRTVHLSDIPAGTYTLHMKGANDDGVWNELGGRSSLRSCRLLGDLMVPWPDLAGHCRLDLRVGMSSG
jgi:hypothetical protein